MLYFDVIIMFYKTFSFLFENFKSLHSIKLLSHYHSQFSLSRNMIAIEYQVFKLYSTDTFINCLIKEVQIFLPADCQSIYKEMLKVQS